MEPFLPAYFSWLPDHHAKATDVFTQTWPSAGVGRFTPFALLLRLMSKILSRCIRLLLIALIFRAQLWFPTLFYLLCADPLLLLWDPLLLRDPRGNPHPLILHHRRPLVT